MKKVVYISCALVTLSLLGFLTYTKQSQSIVNSDTAFVRGPMLKPRGDMPLEVYVKQTCISSFTQEGYARGVLKMSNNEPSRNAVKYDKDTNTYCECFSNWVVDNIQLDNNYQFTTTFYEATMTNIRMTYHDVPLMASGKEIFDRIKAYETLYDLNAESFQKNINKNIDQIDAANNICMSTIS